MPQSPPPPGEPVGLRDDGARWFEPVLAESVDAAPLARAGSDCVVAPGRGQPQRAAGLWDEVRWIGFADPGEPAVPVPGAGAPAAVFKSQPAEIEMPEEERDAEVRPFPVAAPEGAAFPASVLRSGRRLPIARGIAVLALIALAAYYGGKRLADPAQTARPDLVAAAAPIAVTPPSPPAADASVTAQPASVPLPAQAPQHPGVAPAQTSAAPAHALPYRERAAAGEPAAQYNLAVLYARGDDGVAQDFGKAAAWFRKAALGGSLPAEFNLGVMYERGLGVEANMERAVAWYRRAAERDYPAAAYNLAIAFAEGRGTPQDWVAAARWYHAAALRGLVPAMVNFAILYERGDGVERSLPDAYAWYRAAARRGDAVAEKRARELFEKLPNSAKAEAVLQAASLVDELGEDGAPAAPPPGPAAPAKAGRLVGGVPPAASRVPRQRAAPRQPGG